VLHSFTGGSDGAYPEAGLIADAAGNLYGTTWGGGAGGQGTVFQLDPSGNLTVLYSFTGGDGSRPGASLLADAAGNLYGTTSSGGATASCPGGLRHGVRADSASEFYCGPGEAKYGHESALSRSAADRPPVTTYGLSNIGDYSRASHEHVFGFARESRAGW
jgi:uncharacterized repeat protein (TIGR03803 family)